MEKQEITNTNEQSRVDLAELHAKMLSCEGSTRNKSASECTTGEEFRAITIGICAMNKKTLAKPMQNILTRLAAHEFIEVVIFSDEVILDNPVEEWPVCDCLVAFYSKGFPLDKAIQYVELRKPMVINDLQEQYALMDRRQVYQTLVKNGVEVPKHVIVNRDHSLQEQEPIVIENDDVLEVGGQAFHKPFVEKPVSAEDHNVYIYFPSDYGGGTQRLFRKVKNRSSSYSKESSVRKDGSYIYEEFLATDGTDVKVYVVGPDYAHAEARKSPALDGKVERNTEGKEVRHPVILNAMEKLIARKVCQAFKQTVCGFDLLRANGKSYVCDVNGFSFVKNSEKYYDDCAQILLEMVTAQLAPHLFPRTPPSVEYLVEEVPQLPIPIPKTDNRLELRCVVGVIRHGDRTPKQKMKMIVTHWRFIELFRELNGFDKGEVKIKKPKLLQRVLDISRYLLDDLEDSTDPSAQEIEEAAHKLRQLRAVLEMYGKFSGINRKVQLKHINKTHSDQDTQLLLILKWGGELTPMGQRQAEELGRAFRCMYPGGEGEYASLPGSGFLRLHSTYRHDLKVYASDEGRVQMTAAAFTKGLLDLEGNLASVLVHLVKRDQAATNMLDTNTDAEEAMTTVKKRLHSLMRSTSDFTSHSYSELVPTEVESIKSAMKIVGNPSVMNEQLHQNISVLLEEIKQLHKESQNENGHDYNGLLYQNESLHLMVNRWAKLVKDFKSKSGHFDISKVPDIYDCIKYDMLHNRCLRLKSAPNVTSCAMPLADIVIPQEYGITMDEKFDIGKKICTPLFKKIQSDFHRTIVNEQADVIHRLDARLSKGVVSPNRHVRSRLYFTSEGHIHSLVNMLRYGGLDKHLKDSSVLNETVKEINRCPELNYLTQIIFTLFEDPTKNLKAPDRFRVEVRFSPGIKFRQQVFDDDSDGISPSNSYTSVTPRSSTHFVKRLPQNGDSFRQQRLALEQMMLAKSSPNLKRVFKSPVKTPAYGDATTENCESNFNDDFHFNDQAIQQPSIPNTSKSCLTDKDSSSSSDSPQSQGISQPSVAELTTSVNNVLPQQATDKSTTPSPPCPGGSTQPHTESRGDVCVVDSGLEHSPGSIIIQLPYDQSESTISQELRSDGTTILNTEHTCGLKSRSDTNLMKLRRATDFPEQTAQSINPEDSSLRQSSRSAVHGSMETLEKIELLKGESVTSLDWLGERTPGLVLATELASAIEPLILVCSAPLHEINAFFTSHTQVHLKFDPITPDIAELPTPPKQRSRSTTPIMFTRPPSFKDEDTKSGQQSLTVEKLRDSPTVKGIRHRYQLPASKLSQAPSLDSVLVSPQPFRGVTEREASIATRSLDNLIANNSEKQDLS